MHSHLRKQHRLRIILVALLCLWLLPAHADYRVYKEAMLASAERDRTQIKPRRLEKFQITFSKNNSYLTDADKQLIDTLLKTMEGQKVQIIGRPDAHPLYLLANNRAKSIQTYLLNRGIPITMIEVRIDNSPNPQHKSFYPSDLWVGSEFIEEGIERSNANENRMIRSNQPNQINSNQVDVGTHQILSRLVKIALREDQIDDDKALEFIQSLNDPEKTTPNGFTKIVINALQTNQIDDVTGIKLMTFLTKKEKKHSATNIQPTQVAISAEPKLMIVAADSTVNKKTWFLDKNKTLKENIDGWLKTEGWNPVAWEASNYFQIVVSTTLEGEFFDILRQLSDSAGINMCVKTVDKSLRVTDKNVPCKKADHDNG